MKKNPMPLFLLTLTVVIAFGLLFTGCGLNQANEGAALPTSEEPSAPTVAQREALVEQRLAEIEAREAELAAAEREAAEAASRFVMLTVPSLTALEIDLEDDLSSETSLVGDAVAARVAHDVVVDGLVAIPAGSEILGVVAGVVPSRKFGGQARIAVSFDTLVVPDGTQTSIAAALDLAGRRQKKKDAATIGGAAAGGAILGRILNDNDRSEGTKVGAVLGGAIGAIVAAKNEADPVFLPAGTPLVVTLDAPLTIEVDA